MTDMTDLVAPLKLEVALPGEFATQYPNSNDDDLSLSLANGFGQAQLDGFFGSNTYNVATNSVSPDLSYSGAQLVVLYATESLLRSKLRQIPVSTVYKAGSVEYRQDFSANVIAKELSDLQARKDRLLKQILRIGRAKNAISVTDAYLLKSFGYFPLYGMGEWGGFFGWELMPNFSGGTWW